MSQYWFEPKDYGYGATPANWKGTPGVILASAGFALLADAKTHGQWRWRWGN